MNRKKENNIKGDIEEGSVDCNADSDENEEEIVITKKKMLMTKT